MRRHGRGERMGAAVAGNPRRVEARRKRRERSGSEVSRVAKDSGAPFIPHVVFLHVIQIAGLLAALYFVILRPQAPGWWLAALASYFLSTCLGMAICFHRAIAHRAFTLPPPLEYVFTIFGALGGTGQLDRLGRRASHAPCASGHRGRSPLRPAASAGACSFRSTSRTRTGGASATSSATASIGSCIATMRSIVHLWAAVLAAIDLRAMLFIFLIPAAAQITVTNLSTILGHRHGYRNFRDARRKHQQRAPDRADLGRGLAQQPPRATAQDGSSGRRWWEVDIAGSDHSGLHRVRSGRTPLGHRGLTATMTGISIRSLAHRVPETVVTNDDIVTMLRDAKQRPLRAGRARPDGEACPGRALPLRARRGGISPAKTRRRSAMLLEAADEALDTAGIQIRRRRPDHLRRRGARLAGAGDGRRGPGCDRRGQRDLLRRARRLRELASRPACGAQPHPVRAPTGTRSSLTANPACATSSQLEMPSPAALQHYFAALTLGEAATATFVGGFGERRFPLPVPNVCRRPPALPHASLQRRHVRPRRCDGAGQSAENSSLIRPTWSPRRSAISWTPSSADPEFAAATYDVAFSHAASMKAVEVLARRLGIPLRDLRADARPLRQHLGRLGAARHEPGAGRRAACTREAGADRGGKRRHYGRPRALYLSSRLRLAPSLTVRVHEHAWSKPLARRLRAAVMRGYDAAVKFEIERHRLMLGLLAVACAADLLRLRASEIRQQHDHASSATRRSCRGTTNPTCSASRRATGTCSSSSPATTPLRRGAHADGAAPASRPQFRRRRRRRLLDLLAPDGARRERRDGAADPGAAAAGRGLRRAARARPVRTSGSPPRSSRPTAAIS